jgi:hypothetical protein
MWSSILSFSAQPMLKPYWAIPRWPSDVWDGATAFLS